MVSVCGEGEGLGKANANAGREHRRVLLYYHEHADRVSVWQANRLPRGMFTGQGEVVQRVVMLMRMVLLVLLVLLIA